MKIDFGQNKRVLNFRYKIGLFVVAFFLVLAGGILVGAKNVLAADCGGDVVCACGDQVVEDYVLPDDLDCSGVGGVGLIIANNGATISIDGDGHSLSGLNKTGVGIWAESEKGMSVSIENFSSISNFSTGIYLSQVSGSTISNNELSSNTNGLSLNYSSNNEISGNEFVSNNNGLKLEYSDNNNIEANEASLNVNGFFINYSVNNSLISNQIFSNTGTGILIFGSQSNLTSNEMNLNAIGLSIVSSPGSVLQRNLMSDNNINFSVSSTYDGGYDLDIDTGNLVQGKPVYYLQNETSLVFDNPNDGVGMFWCISCSDITLRNVTLAENNSSSIYFRNTTASLVQNVSVNNSEIGIELKNSTQNNIIGNNIIANNNGITLTGSNENTLAENNINNQNGDGILLDQSSDVEISDNIISNDNTGISASDSDDMIIQDNTFFSDRYGINLFSSDRSSLIGNSFELSNTGAIDITNSDTAVVSSNNIKSSRYGVNLNNSSNSEVGLNILTSNIFDFYDTGSNNNYHNNQVNHNISNRMILFSSPDSARKVAVGERTTFNFSMYKVNGAECPNCSYLLSVSPDEAISSNLDGNQVSGSFVPSRFGRYSLTVTITDPQTGDTTKRSFGYVVGPVIENQVRYYFRSVAPTNSQPGGDADIGSLLFVAPSSDEELNCVGWVQNSPDILPDYPLANVIGFNAHVWRVSRDAGYVGLEKVVTYSNIVDTHQDIESVESSEAVDVSLQDFQWSMDYAKSWYSLSAKVRGGQISLQSTPTHPSYADFLYEYPSALALKSNSNEKINILSATNGESSFGDAQIVLENIDSELASTTISLINSRQPFINGVNIINAQGNSSITANVEANESLSLDSVYLDITPTKGSIQVVVNRWDTSGAYYRQWTETGSEDNISTTHAIGDLNPRVAYSIKSNDTLIDYYISGSDGVIMFASENNILEKSYVLERAPDRDPVNSNLVSRPAVGEGKNEMSVFMGQAQFVGLIDGSGINILSYFNSSALFDILTSKFGVKAGHKIKIIDLDLINNIVTIEVQSEPQVYKLKLNDLLNIDLDGDKINDLSVKFSGLFVNRVELTLKGLVAKAIPDSEKPKAPVIEKFIFKKDLKLGLKNNDVLNLQKYLNSQGFLVAKIGAGSKGHETSLFGSATKAALVKFQKAKKINPASGIFGPITRKVVNK